MLENCTSEMIEFGLWQSEEEVDRQVSDLKTKTLRMRALKAQLNFRRKVLQQKPNSEDMKSIYKFSKKAENEKTETLTAEELTENVKKLVRHAFNIEPRPSDRDENFKRKYTLITDMTF